MTQIYFKAMGCHILAVIDSEAPSARRQLAQVPDWFEEWEQTLSRFRPESELSRVNRHPGEKQALSPVFWEVLRLAIENSGRSQGLVVPTLLPALQAAGYDRSFESLSANPGAAYSPPSQTFSVLQEIPWENLHLDELTHSLTLPAGCGLDFGGVAKGWAAHKAMLRLQKYGPVLVDAGGDIAVSSLRPDGKRWLIGVTDPFDHSQTIINIGLGRGGVATSGIDYRKWQQNETWRHHIIDPRTLEPAQTDLISATIIAATVIEAEMLAKMVLILGSQAGMELLKNTPNTAALLVRADGSRLRSNRFQQFIGQG